MRKNAPRDACDAGIVIPPSGRHQGRERQQYFHNRVPRLTRMLNELSEGIANFAENGRKKLEVVYMMLIQCFQVYPRLLQLTNA